jgi:hypothetical protein
MNQKKWQLLSITVRLAIVFVLVATMYLGAPGANDNIEVASAANPRCSDSKQEPLAHKACVLHTQPPNPGWIEVACSAVPAHEGHGDTQVVRGADCHPEPPPYEMCSETGDWILVSSTDWTWDEAAQDFYRVHTYKLYDANDSSHECDSKTEKEWQGYEPPEVEYSLTVTKSNTCDEWEVFATASPTETLIISYHPMSAGTWWAKDMFAVTVIAYWEDHTLTETIIVKKPEGCDDEPTIEVTPTVTITPTGVLTTEVAIAVAEAESCEVECDICLELRRAANALEEANSLKLQELELLERQVEAAEESAHAANKANEIAERAADAIERQAEALEEANHLTRAVGSDDRGIPLGYFLVAFLFALLAAALAAAWARHRK